MSEIGDLRIDVRDIQRDLREIQEQIHTEEGVTLQDVYNMLIEVHDRLEDLERELRDVAIRVDSLE